MPNSNLTDEQQATFYDDMERELNISVRDLIHTTAQMTKVQNESREHFTMPMVYLYILLGIIQEAIDQHSLVEN
tara:strand:+ start:247 stop:468 length:222 start_codon:yes stop_codon:yes gene_type:complete